MPQKVISVQSAVDSLKRQQQTEYFETAALILDIGERYARFEVVEIETSEACWHCIEKLPHENVYEVLSHNRITKKRLCSKSCLIGAENAELEMFGCTAPKHAPAGKILIKPITSADLPRIYSGRILAYNQAAAKKLKKLREKFKIKNKQ